ncbi:SDR family NAD(P)-dependent oxidoreductase [Aquisalimonas lutea]|uniref:SDR family NAD(P)-dependent oxidoreductase n=1 Tax=Aquisalimonas lutea TaxID=1327750 RepID=UPI0025B2EF03|nr:SDR family NAD(P)-dependent oxidoreductase [Aquisalimonas lutea]MDN3516158.1 SDR family NAD(P)-dependent oxidoreductase [Aquisalimonas lutea]
MSQRMVVTGGGSGLGRAICRELAERGLQVVAVGRRRDALEGTRSLDPERITTVAADLATAEGRAEVVEALGDGSLAGLVHNAGALEPIGPLAGVRLEDWRQAQAVNVEAPLFLTQGLLDNLQGGRVLHMSSGAAHHGYAGWGSYCTGKAALHMIYQVLREELRDRGIAVGSLRPGVVDTPMQALIREQPPERFPMVQRFLDLHATGQLEDPAEVARFTAWLLLEVEADAFSAEEWSFTEPAHRERWGG